MTTWIVGDIHGCAEELSELVTSLALKPDDTFVSVGDLFHRGPDPFGVMTILRDLKAPFVLGNHERAVLARCGLAPRRVDAADRAPVRETFPDLDDADLDGDGRQPCFVEPHQRVEILRFLQAHSGYALHSRAIRNAGRTPDGRSFLVVHAGVLPGRRVEDHPIDAITSVRRLETSGRPWWYERYEGDDLVLFGHTPSPLPRAWRARGKLLALGLDTGCVYGGKLTAYSPELDEFAVVPARSAYARR